MRLPPAMAVHTALQVILALALFGLLQFQAFRHNHRFDLTPEQAFVLSDQARQIAERLRVPARITVFYNSQETGRRRELLDLLEQFHDANPRIDFRLVDLDRSPRLAHELGVSSYNSGVLEAAGRRIPLRMVDEQAVASALLQVAQRRRHVACFVTGHGERRPSDADERSGYSAAAKALEAENFQVREVRLLVSDSLDQCDVAILAGPSHDLLSGEVEALEAFLHSGGRVLLMVDPDAPSGISALLRRFGVIAGNDLLVDEQSRLIGWDSFVPHVPIFDQATFRGKLKAEAIFSLARTVRPAPEPPAGLRVRLLAMSSPDSWAYVGGTAVPDEDVRFRPGKDKPGPHPVALLVEVPASGNDRGRSQRDGQLVVFGDSDFASNFYFNLLGNKDLFLSTMAVLAGQPELVVPRRKGRPGGSISPIVLEARQARLLFWSVEVIPPVAVLLIGLSVWVRRRRLRGGR